MLQCTRKIEAVARRSRQPDPPPQDGCTPEQVGQQKLPCELKAVEKFLAPFKKRLERGRQFSAVPGTAFIRLGGT